MLQLPAREMESLTMRKEGPHAAEQARKQPHRKATDGREQRRQRQGSSWKSLDDKIFLNTLEHNQDLCLT